MRRYRRRILPLRDLEVNTLNSCGLTQQIQHVELSNSSSNTPNSAVTNVMKLKLELCYGIIELKIHFI